MWNSSSWYSLFPWWHKWYTIGTHIIAIVPGDSICSTSSEAKAKEEKPAKLVSIIKTRLLITIRTTMINSRLVQLLGLCSSRSYSTVTMSKWGCSWSSVKISVLVFSWAKSPIPQRNCSWPYMGAVNNSIKVWYVLVIWTTWCTWVQSTIAIIHSVYWYVCSGQSIVKIYNNNNNNNNDNNNNNNNKY